MQTENATIDRMANATTPRIPQQWQQLRRTFMTRTTFEANARRPTIALATKTAGKMATDERKFCRFSGAEILPCTHAVTASQHTHSSHPIRSIRCSGRAGERTLCSRATPIPNVVRQLVASSKSCTPKCEQRQCETPMARMPGMRAQTKKPHYGRPLFMALIFGC